MKRWFWLGFGFLVVASLSAGSYVMLAPKLGHATKAEIDAALPASLKVVDPPDPAAEERYTRLIELIKPLDRDPLNLKGPKAGKSTSENEAGLSKIEKLLAEGDLKVPDRKGDMLFRDLPSLKNAAKLMSLACEAAWIDQDRKACGRWAVLGIRYGDALGRSGGVVIDQLVDVAVKAISVRVAYRAEIEGGLDASGRAKLLALLPPRDGSSPEMAAAMRRDFQWGWRPILLDPQAHEKELAEFTTDFSTADFDSKPNEKLAGTFDPVASARMSGAIYDALIADLNRPFREALHKETALIAEASKGLPDLPKSEGFDKFWYRVRMNAGRNTLGRQQASMVVFTQLGEAVARQAAAENLTRAVILLRMGQTPRIQDPFGKGLLQFDRKRKIVWSVGKDGKNDGGDIGRGGVTTSSDYGFPYGDHSWAPVSVTTPAMGMPPAGFGPGPGAPGSPPGAPGR